MTFEMVMVVLIGHWVADFVCQSDEMAINKSKCNFWLTRHVLTYTVCMAVVGGLIFSDHIGIGGNNYLFGYALYAWLITNFVLHWITDYVTSRINSWLWTNEHRHYFFVSVGFDQLIHYACLFGTYMLVLSYVK